MIAKWLQIDKIKFANCRGRRPRRPVHTQTNFPYKSKFEYKSNHKLCRAEDDIDSNEGNSLPTRQFATSEGGNCEECHHEEHYRNVKQK